MTIWLYERYIFDRDQEFLQLLKDKGHEVRLVDYLRFPDPSSTLDKISEDSCVIFRGSLNLGRTILRSRPWTPGAYLDEKQLNCLNYYTYLGDYLLNNRYHILSLSELMRRKEEMFDTYGSTDLFVRPVSNMKTFHAGCFNLAEYDLKSFTSKLRTEKTTTVLVSSKKPISREWRFFFYKDQPITGSLYIQDDEVICEPYPEDGPIISYLAEVMNKARWYPEKLWSIDVCEVKGEFHVLELGSFSCAGEYACDLSKYIDFGTLAAKEDWEETFLE